MRVLGIDYGRKRIGLAVSDASGTLARAWKTLERRGGANEVASAIAGEIEALAVQGDVISAIVLGYPRRLTGEPSDAAPAVEAVAAGLRRRMEIPIVLQDERLTSREAESRLAAREKDWRKRKKALDAEAAAIILQDYLDSVPRAAADGEGA